MKYGRNNYMNNTQNQYGNIQLCPICHKPLEKARTIITGRTKCLACQKILRHEYNEGRKMIILAKILVRVHA